MMVTTGNNFFLILLIKKYLTIETENINFLSLSLFSLLLLLLQFSIVLNFLITLSVFNQNYTSFLLFNHFCQFSMSRFHSILLLLYFDFFVCLLLTPPPYLVKQAHITRFSSSTFHFQASTFLIFHPAITFPTSIFMSYIPPPLPSSPHPHPPLPSSPPPLHPPPLPLFINILHSLSVFLVLVLHFLSLLLHFRYFLTIPQFLFSSKSSPPPWELLPLPRNYHIAHVRAPNSTSWISYVYSGRRTSASSLLFSFYYFHCFSRDVNKVMSHLVCLVYQFFL